MIALLLSLLFTPSAPATVLLQSPTARVLDYRAALRADSDAISPTRHYLAAHPVATAREELLTDFTAAQTSFLQSARADAQTRFERVVARLPEEDWRREDREVFLLAYFRLAQLAAENEARDRWLRASLSLGDELNLDAALVPPPLIARRRELQLALPARSWRPPEGWTAVLINGQPCRELDCGRWETVAEKLRVTFLSDRWLPQTLFVRGPELSRLHPETIPWVSGDCESPQVHARVHEFTSYKIFWNLQCEAKPQARVRDREPAALQLPAAPSAPTSTPLYRNKWLWAGVGLVVAALVIHETQRHESREPTTSYGY
jgi:hypothetical protein